MRSSSRSDQSEEDVREGDIAGWWTRYGQNSAGTSGCARAGDKGAFLSHRGQRSLLDGSEEDRSTHGEFQKSYWYEAMPTRSGKSKLTIYRPTSTGNKGGLRGRSHRAHTRRG